MGYDINETIKTEPKRKNHKFDYLTDICERCGVERTKVSNVGSGFNLSMINHFHWEYKKPDGEFKDEFINCEK